jgi:hypothetical protein
MIPKSAMNFTQAWIFLALFTSYKAFAGGCEIDAVRSASSDTACFLTTSGNAFKVPGQDSIPGSRVTRLLICPVAEDADGASTSVATRSSNHMRYTF